MESQIIKHRGSVRDGKLFINDMIVYRHCLDKLDGKKIVVTLQEESRDPSIQMRNYYNGILLPAALEDEQLRGWTKNELDNHLTRMFLDHRTPDKSTISKERHAWLIGKAIIYFDQMGIEVPMPDKNLIKHKYHDTEKTKDKKDN